MENTAQSFPFPSLPLSLSFLSSCFPLAMKFLILYHMTAVLKVPKLDKQLYLALWDYA